MLCLLSRFAKIAFAITFITNEALGIKLKHNDIFEVEEIHSWRYLEYLQVNSSNPEKAVFTGMQVWRDKIFINMPRLYDNIPITFGWIPRNGDIPSEDQPIRPFPDYSWQSAEAEGRCRGFVSTFRSRIDRCNRIWTIDSGRINALGSIPPFNPRIPCPPRVMGFDLETGQHVRTAFVPDNVINNMTTFTSLSVEFVPGGGCDDLYIYLSDTLGWGIVVYDVRRNRFWRHEHDSFEPDPNQFWASINGERFFMNDGIIGSTVAHFKGERVLLFHPYAGRVMYYVPTRFLNEPPTGAILPVRPLMIQPSQGIAMVTDPKTNIVYFSTIKECSVLQWNPSNFFTRDPVIVAQDFTTLQVVNDFSVADGEIYLASNRLHGLLNDSYYKNSTNFRIMKLKRSKKPH